MVVDLVLKGGKTVTSTGIAQAGLAIDKGKIVAVTKENLLPKADKVLNVRGLFIMPGLIDAHVHVYDPGFIHESFETGTKAAAVGGITTIIDMASSVNLRTSTVTNLFEKKEVGEREAFVDFALYGGEISDERDLKEIQELVQAGVVGFGEIMMCGDTPIKNDETLSEAFRLISKAKSIAAVHAEDKLMLDHYKKKLSDESRTDALAFADARPNQAEAGAVTKALSLSERAGVKLHICHLSTKQGANLIREAKTRGLNVTTEVCPHHLYFTRKDYEKLGPYVITTPPLRNKEDVNQLWRGLQDGLIDLIVSDHCAFTKNEKDKGLENIWNTPPGIPGLETLALVMLGKGVKEHRISLEKFVECTSEKPAKIFGLYPKKGALQKGSDADLTIVDLHQKHIIRSEDLKCVADYTPYEGWAVEANVLMTLVRGEIVAREGEIIGRKGYGEFVRPSADKTENVLK